MDARTVALVRERAAYRCEYCQIAQEQDPFFTFHVEHVIARKHEGASDPDSLALSCHQDNLHKGTNLTGIDPVTRRVTRLYHPRRQNRLALREALLDAGEFPPRLP